VNVYSYRGRIPIIIVYAARVLSGALTLDEEGLEAGTFTSETVPWDALAFRSTREALQDYFAGRLYRQARGVPEAG
jgi:8-oxo-dGTP diphosphatase